MSYHSAHLNIKGGDISQQQQQSVSDCSRHSKYYYEQGILKKLLKIDYNSSMPIDMKHAYFMALKDEETESPKE